MRFDDKQVRDFLLKFLTKSGKSLGSSYFKYKFTVDCSKEWILLLDIILTKTAVIYAITFGLNY